MKGGGEVERRLDGMEAWEVFLGVGSLRMKNFGVSYTYIYFMIDQLFLFSVIRDTCT